MRKAGAALVAVLLAGTSAWAQTVQPAPVRQSVDGNGVDLFLGTLNVSREDISMGNAQSGMSYSRIWRNTAWVDSYDVHLVRNGSTVTITSGGTAESFNLSYAWVNAQGGSSTLVQNSGYSWTYTSADGTVYQLDSTASYSALGSGDAARVINITKPNGVVLSFSYYTAPYCTQAGSPGEPNCGPTLSSGRLSSVTSNLGYQLNYAYARDDIDGPATRASFYTVTAVTLINLANNVSRSASYTGKTGATDMGGRSWAYQFSGNSITDIQRPGRGYDIHIDYDGLGRVGGVRNAANITTAYTYSDDTNSNERTVTVQVGSNPSSRAVFDLNTQLMKRSVDENGLTTSYEHDGSGRLTKVTAQDGNSVEYTYDTRGNVTQTTAHRKAGDNRGDIATSAGFEAGCSNAKTCNQPQWTRDAKGQQTDYTYDGGTGLVTSVNRPANQQGVRPYLAYDYTSVSSPWGGSITLLSGTRTCQNGSWGCSGTGAVVGSAYAYNGSGGNFLLRTVSTGARDGSLYNSVTYDYDDLRNVNAVTDPNGELWRSGYDGARRQVWTLTPDPDGSGNMRGKMVRTNYKGDGAVDSVEIGTGNPDGGGFYQYYMTAYVYDGAGRKTMATLLQNNVSLSKTQWSYDALGRLDCTAVRMNPGAYDTLPGVCELSAQGSDGPDRISRVEYDAASRVTRSWAGYRTAQATYTDQDWTNNNRLHRVYGPSSDINQRGPATTYEYDGLDRLQFTCFNTTGCTGSDYEQYDYDANGNPTWRRLRDGNVMTLGYDALDRLTSRTPPAYTFRDQPTSYIYDNLNHLLQANVSNTGNNMSISMEYDALGRVTVEHQPFSSVGYGYDAAGNRTYVGYGDGYWVDYRYDNGGRLTDVIEQGQTLLAKYYYDEMGRRSATGRRNYGQSYYAYDGKPWLTSMTHDLNGTANDLTTSYAHDAAGGIVRKDSSNEAYAWAQNYNVNRTYDVNALNQYTRSGSTTLGYDARGNLTSAPTPNTGGNGATSGSVGYIYSADNQIIHQGPNNYVLNYDALGRLSTDQAEGRRFGYAGSQLLLEQDNGGNTIERYVYGADEAPLLRYDGQGYGTRRWLYTDERGSVIAIADDGGNAQTLNKYDEFGIPASTNDGRFGYTGQMWLPSLGMWHYKARTYSPTLGRFLQTDPIGYRDGLNWYNYAGGDPVNFTDPLGLSTVENNNKRNGGEPVAGEPGTGSNYGSQSDDGGEIVVTGARDKDPAPSAPPPTDMNFQFPTTPSSTQNDSITVSCDAACRLRILGHTAAAIAGRAIALPATLAMMIYDAFNDPLCCFVAGTQVSTPQGLRAIETLKVGDLVISRSDNTGETAAKPIVKITPAHERRIWTVTVSYKGKDGRWRDERYETTEDHPWRTVDKRWVNSAALKHGQTLARENGTSIVVGVTDTGKTKLTYNLEIADFHTYFVGEAGSWVHNSCFSTSEVAGLNKLFGQGAPGAQKLVDRLKSGANVPLPPGITLQTLQNYRDTVSLKPGTAAAQVNILRFQAIDILLGR